MVLRGFRPHASRSRRLVHLQEKLAAGRVAFGRAGRRADAGALQRAGRTRAGRADRGGPESGGAHQAGAGGALPRPRAEHGAVLFLGSRHAARRRRAVAVARVASGRVAFSLARARAAAHRRRRRAGRARRRARSGRGGPDGVGHGCRRGARCARAEAERRRCAGRRAPVRPPGAVRAVAVHAALPARAGEPDADPGAQRRGARERRVRRDARRGRALRRDPVGRVLPRGGGLRVARDAEHHDRGGCDSERGCVGAHGSARSPVRARVVASSAASGGSTCVVASSAVARGSIDAAHGRSAQRAAEVRTAQVRPAQVRPAHVGAAEVRAAAEACAEGRQRGRADRRGRRGGRRGALRRGYCRLQARAARAGLASQRAPRGAVRATRPGQARARQRQRSGAQLRQGAGGRSARRRGVLRGRGAPEAAARLRAPRSAAPPACRCVALRRGARAGVQGAGRHVAP